MSHSYRNFFLVRLNRVFMEISIVARLLGEALVYSRVLEVGVAGFSFGVGKDNVECRLYGRTEMQLPLSDKLEALCARPATGAGARC